MRNVQIVLVDGNIETKDIKNTLESIGFNVPAVFSTGEEALEKIFDIRPDLVLIDISLPGEIDGIELAHKFKEMEIPFIFSTSHYDGPIISRAMKTQPYGYLVKPYEKIELKIVIEMALYKKNAENKLIWTKNRLQIGMDMAKMVYWEYDTEKDLFTFDDQFYALYGTSAEEEGGNLLSANEYIERFVDPSAYELMELELKKTFEVNDPDFISTVRHWIIRGGGERRFIIVRFRIMFDRNGQKIGTMGVNQDITEQKVAEDALAKSLDEKNILLKEIHHRVKNNLMIMSSLLNLQSRQIKDQDAREVFKESQNRAKSMALIHERLYLSTDLKKIDFGEYIRSLATDLYHSMVSDPNQIKLQIDVEDLKIDINTVVPMGLIVNELVTNSIKYAFPDNKKGYINIGLYKQNEKIILRVIDNGVGFPEDLDYKNTNSLGLQLVNNLIIQINGELELDKKNQGTVFTIIFEEAE
ncbi:histidine kinase dimerization/phosphoacceptor domain -containing protein [Methanobacterium alcaliphilum]|uniref:histidine kinase dimerization/phosphoacceptor domain -containing protein n=1 Tax=Methanobacterium alcaliphilum TaxID=392018 RepID=UPI00200A0D9D|nr:response regulator [Methanobacterium alcaliphilum]